MASSEPPDDVSDGQRHVGAPVHPLRFGLASKTGPGVGYKQSITRRRSRGGRSSIPSFLRRTRYLATAAGGSASSVNKKSMTLVPGSIIKDFVMNNPLIVTFIAVLESSNWYF